MRGSLFATCAVATALIGGVAHANTLAIDYYQVPDAALYTGHGTDFGVCCSTGDGATLPDIAVGSPLLGGLPVTSGGPNPVVDVSTSGQILWWTPSLSTGVQSTGSGVVTLTYSSNMFAPNSTGANDAAYFETALLSGIIHGTGTDVQLSVASDDDALVYLDGQYVGGNPGVHGTGSTTINLGDLFGAQSLEIFYADRAQVGANLEVSLTGATVTAAPELSTWAMMLLGFAGLGFAGYRGSRKDAAIPV